MKRAILPIIVFVVAALIGHFATIHAAPGFIMGKAMSRMEAAGLSLNRFSLTPRTTPQTQSVVRPSPDLAYSICRYDLSGNEALRVVAGLYDNYASVSFFDANTINFATVRIGAGDLPSSGSEVILRARGAGPVESFSSAPQIETPTRRGLILIRRLAPTQESYDKVQEISSDDSCTGLADPRIQPVAD